MTHTFYAMVEAADLAVAGDELICTLGLALGGPGDRRVSYRRRGDASTIGRWVHSIMEITGSSQWSRVPGLSIRVQMSNDGQVCALGHPMVERWVQALDGATPTIARPETGVALRHINRYRASRGQRELDPEKSLWTQDDVETEAKRLGWKP